MGYWVLVLMKSIFSYDVIIRIFLYLLLKKWYFKVCKIIWIFLDDKEGICGFMKSKFCRIWVREEFGGFICYFDN